MAFVVGFWREPVREIHGESTTRMLRIIEVWSHADGVKLVGDINERNHTSLPQRAHWTWRATVAGLISSSESLRCAMAW